jgi:hypothetical protein
MKIVIRGARMFSWSVDYVDGTRKGEIGNGDDMRKV